MNARRLILPLLVALTCVGAGITVLPAGAATKTPAHKSHHRVKNLRVVDASVFPKIQGFFIVSSIYMISEKASDVILRDQRGPKTEWPKLPKK